MEAVLNRWRGTSSKGNLAYASYLVILVGLMSQWYWGLLVGAVYVAGESFAWGKWIGYLVGDRRETEVWNKMGTGFPWISQTAELVFKQDRDYLNYCRLALVIRGVYWWMPVLAIGAMAGLVAWWYVIVGGLLAGIGFVVACEIGRVWEYEYKSKWFSMSQGWENQEVVYGGIQFLVVTLPLIVGGLWK